MTIDAAGALPWVKPQLPSSDRLPPPSVAPPAQLVPLLEPARIVLASVTVPELLRMASALTDVITTRSHGNGEQ